MNNNYHVPIFGNQNKNVFGLKHYGEIPKTINKADGDPWDVAVPGYNSLPIGKN